MKSLLDIGRILASEPALDWEFLDRTMAAARLTAPGKAALAAINVLGGHCDIAPPNGAFAAARFADAVGDLETGFAGGFPFQRKLSREIFLTAEPRVALRRLGDRLIPPSIDQNPCAQSRVPMDIMVHGSWVSLIH
ncbi:MAG: hypothetical protein O2985_05960, partial [Proteobacteria bacterium]|nr:hypothetical protein [Pseudomonadota bacterium]